MNKKYNIIYADPPWQFKNYSDKWHKDRKESRWVANHYDCMTPEEIKKLPVQNICENDAVLLLWVTFPKLVEGLELIKNWVLNLIWGHLNGQQSVLFLALNLVGLHEKVKCFYLD